jgi:hypothetical protein
MAFRTHKHWYDNIFTDEVRVFKLSYLGFQSPSLRELEV